MASPSIVIKVKYGETLRRFNALVKGDQHLQLNMEEFRAKICSLFNFPPDGNFTLTYVDEDGDQVTLADNEDLHDVVIQGLNPVRVTVHLNSSDGAFSSTPSSGNSTSSRSSAQTSPENIIPAVADVLKSLPEPVHDAITKLSAELASKAASANPVVMDLVENVSKMVQALRNPPHSCSGTATSNHEVRADDGIRCNEIRSTEPLSKSTQAPKVVEMSKGTEPVTSPVPPYFFFQKGKDAKAQCSAGISVINNDVTLGAFRGKHENKATGSECLQNSIDPFKVRLERREDAIRYYRDSKYGGTSSPSTFSSPPVSVPRVCRDDERHFSPQPFNGNFYNADGMGSIFHKGIRCDGCGVLPITGPRFKSKVKYDYDLCNICFTRIGNYSDYTRIDFPSPKRRMCKGFYDAASPHLNPIQPLVSGHLNQLRLRLDSSFIKDVNVMDGTIVAPATPFTKIWRMHNSGTLPWSHGLQLLWIGGDRFSSSDSVTIEVPVNGVDVGKEVDIAVDFTAPELPGQYISYWRMAESSGHKFGQRVWVLIQVDASLKEDDSACESSLSLYFNLPPENSADPTTVKTETSTDDQNLKIEIGDLNLPINDDLISGSVVSCAASTSSPSPSVSPSVCTYNPAPPVSSPISQSLIDADLQPPSSLPFDSNPKDSSANSSEVENEGKNEAMDSNLEMPNKEKNAVEESLLKELNEMGFKQIDLNKEVLRVNEYDLEKSVDELCGVSEWDPILEELQEMGFHDKVMNKKLLEKNNGSIMRVVMDLVSGEEA